MRLVNDLPARSNRFRNVCYLPECMSHDYVSSGVLEVCDNFSCDCMDIVAVSL